MGSLRLSHSELSYSEPLRTIGGATLLRADTMSWSLLTPVTLAYGNFFSIQSAIFPINTNV